MASPTFSASLDAGRLRFEAGGFHSAHEAWESGWRQTHGPEKRVLQVLVLWSAALHHHSRGKELGAEVLMKATRVDGVYSADPEKNPHAVRYENLTYEQVLRDDLKVMDMTAIGMCLDNDLPILVFNFKKEGNIERAIAGEAIGTWVGKTARPRHAVSA